MNKLMMALGASAIALAGAGFALAKPKVYQLPDETAVLRPGPGMDAAQNNCMSCHSVDYINFQPSKKGQAFWEAEVQKMIKVYHASINEADAKAIAEYLAQTY